MSTVSYKIHIALQKEKKLNVLSWRSIHETIFSFVSITYIQYFQTWHIFYSWKMVATCHFFCVRLIVNIYWNLVFSITCLIFISSKIYSPLLYINKHSFNIMKTKYFRNLMYMSKSITFQLTIVVAIAADLLLYIYAQLTKSKRIIQDLKYV